jgi:hypothetical protein
MLRTLTILVLLSAAACSDAPRSSTAPPTSSDALRTGLTGHGLPRGAFRTRVEALREEWADARIMSGDPWFIAGKLEGRLTQASLASFAKKIVTDRLVDDELQVRDLTTDALDYEDAHVKEAARVVAVDGFVYDGDNPRTIEPVEQNIRELLAFLGRTDALDVVKVTGQTTVDDVTRRVTEYLFVNRESKLYVAFCAREGSN